MSRPRMKISSSVITRISKIQKPSTGQLVGAWNDDTLLVLGFCRSSVQRTINEETKQWEWEYLSDQDITLNLPAGVFICGTTLISLKKGDIEMHKWVKEALMDYDFSDPLLLTANLETQETKVEVFKNGQFKDTQYEVISISEVKKLFLNLRLTARISISCDFLMEAIEDALYVLEKKLLGGHAIFQFQDNIYVTGEHSTNVKGLPASATIEDLIDRCKEKKKKVEGDSSRAAVDIEKFDIKVFFKGSSDTGSSAPAIKYNKRDFICGQINLLIDSLALMQRGAKLQKLYSLLVQSICNNLKLNEECLFMQFETEKEKIVSLPKTYHFLPEDFQHPISIVYPSKWEEEQLENNRKTFHMIFSLPMDKPCLRRGNSIDAQNNMTSLLVNPHIGLAPSGVKDGEVSLVQGNYAYHHYMQDKFDDNGWGCAYRSLQTIFSWFRFQGFTDKPVPSHKLIQETLAETGDKPFSFVGTRQWIGSTEISFVLDEMLQVPCRIVSVSSGEELSTKGGELSHHFKTQGTPVMIGGGVLAHTILGVDYNKKTGSLKFLILDPHYTGGEDLNIIQAKGWCGWKGLDFWKKDSFYNMCLPLRPKCV